MAKRKPKYNLRRKTSQRSPYDRILIVCEGEKTEPIYFKVLIDKFKINTANVSITGDCGTDPKSVQKKAKEEQKKANQEKNPYDKIFCVFDKDSHPNYSQTVTSINNSKIYKAINSVPCFEYWLLLHFVYTDAPFFKTENKSICENVGEKLKEYVSNYEKSSNDVEVFLDKIDVAIKNSIKSMQNAVKNNTDMPSSNVHELVEYIQKLES